MCTTYTFINVFAIWNYPYCDAKRIYKTCLVCSLHSGTTITDKASDALSRDQIYPGGDKIQNIKHER